MDKILKYCTNYFIKTHLNKLKLQIELQKSTQLDLRGTWWSKSISVIALDNEAVANTNLFYLAKAPCEVRSFSKTTSKTTKVICNAWFRFHLLSRSKKYLEFCSTNEIDPEFLHHPKCWEYCSEIKIDPESLLLNVLSPNQNYI